MPKRKVYKKTAAQEILIAHLHELKAGLVVPEYRFTPDRRWRFDLYLGEHNIGIECSGGKWHGGHSRGSEVDDEYLKLNTAQMLGYRVLQFTNEYVLDGSAKEFLKRFLGERR